MSMIASNGNGNNIKQLMMVKKLEIVTRHFQEAGKVHQTPNTAIAKKKIPSSWHKTSENYSRLQEY